MQAQIPAREDAATSTPPCHSTLCRSDASEDELTRSAIPLPRTEAGRGFGPSYSSINLDGARPGRRGCSRLALKALLPMSFAFVPESLRALAAHLPFGLDNTERAGAAFRCWRESDAGEGAAEKHAVELWTYCFVRRYFLVKFAVRPARPASDLAELEERAYQKIEQARTEVRFPERYPHWVSVVCKNTYLNYLRRNRPARQSIDEEEGPALQSDRQVRGDVGLTKKVVTEAVERLPEYLQPVARLRFLESHSYEAIREKTGTAVPTARSYASRARQRLRKDPEVRALADLAPLE